MSTPVDQLPDCQFCDKKASYIYGTDVGMSGVKNPVYTCLSPKCVVQAKGLYFFGETDADKET